MWYHGNHTWAAHRWYRTPTESMVYLFVGYDRLLTYPRFELVQCVILGIMTDILILRRLSIMIVSDPQTRYTLQCGSLRDHGG